MLISMLLCICICLSLIFNGYMENIFIVLSVGLFYKLIFVDKEYKYIAYSAVISYILVSVLMMTLFRNYIKFNDIQPEKEKQETVVLLVSEGESRNYNMKERMTELYYTKGSKSYLTLVPNLYKYKSYYAELGSSDFKEKSEDIASKLRPKLGANYKVVNSYIHSEPYFENSLEDIIEKGYKKIIICPVFMTEGEGFRVFKERYESLDLSTYNLTQLDVLNTFYKSENLSVLYKNEILKNMTHSGKEAGIILVGIKNKNNLEQDILFRERLRDDILRSQKNNSNIKIKLPLLENNKKDIIKSGEELLEYGIDNLYVVLPTCTIDTMYTKHLVESILRELDNGNTKFYYVNQNIKTDILVEEIITKVILSKIGG